MSALLREGWGSTRLSGVGQDFSRFLLVWTSSCQMRGSPVTFRINSCTQLSSSGAALPLTFYQVSLSAMQLHLLHFKLDGGIPQWPFPLSSAHFFLLTRNFEVFSSRSWATLSERAYCQYVWAWVHFKIVAPGTPWGGKVQCKGLCWYLVDFCLPKY